MILNLVKRLIILLLCFKTVLSHSQPPLVNGILGLICENSVQSLDYWEATYIHDFTYKKLIGDEKLIQKTNYTTSFKNRFTQYSTLYSSPLHLMVKMSNWFPAYLSLIESKITYTDNMEIRDREFSTVEFHPPNCKVDYLGYSITLPQKPNEVPAYKFFIKKEYWNKLDYVNKVFTVSHFIFGGSDNPDEPEHSRFKRLRFENGLFLSDQLFTLSEGGFLNLID
jgi:hypothetical protein